MKNDQVGRTVILGPRGHCTVPAELAICLTSLDPRASRRTVRRALAGAPDSTVEALSSALIRIGVIDETRSRVTIMTITMSAISMIGVVLAVTHAGEASLLFAACIVPGAILLHEYGHELAGRFTAGEAGALLLGWYPGLTYKPHGGSRVSVPVLLGGTCADAVVILWLTVEWRIATFRLVAGWLIAQLLLNLLPVGATDGAALFPRRAQQFARRSVLRLRFVLALVLYVSVPALLVPNPVIA